MKTALRKQIGTIGVDAGIVYSVDPCYIKHHEIIFNDEKWSEFVKQYYANRENNSAQICSGIVCNTANGDGEFPVYGHYDENGDIMKIEIEFAKENDQAWDFNSMDAG